MRAKSDERFYAAIVWRNCGHLGVNETARLRFEAPRDALAWAGEAVLRDADVLEVTVEFTPARGASVPLWSLLWHGPDLPCRCRHSVPLCASLAHAVLLDGGCSRGEASALAEIAGRRP